MGKRELVALLCLSSLCLVALPQGAVSWFAVCDCDFLIILTKFFHTHPLFQDSAKEWDMGYHSIPRT